METIRRHVQDSMGRVVEGCEGPSERASPAPADGATQELPARPARLTAAPSSLAFPESPRPVSPFSVTWQRWVDLMRAVIQADHDCTTIDAWATLVSLSRTTVCSRCELIDASPRDSLAFARLARTLLAGQAGTWHPEDWLDAREERTVVGLLRRGGLLAFRRGPRPPIVHLFTQHAFHLPEGPLMALYRSLGYANATPAAPDAMLPSARRSGA